MFYVGNIMGEWGLEWRGGEVGFRAADDDVGVPGGELTPEPPGLCSEAGPDRGGTSLAERFDERFLSSVRTRRI
jgi:hypothetical protein